MINALRFGAPDHAKTRHLVSGVVVEGIGGYGNCVGVPTVGGEKRISTPAITATFSSTPCVSASQIRTRFSIPLPRASALPVVYVGSKTGRDGIHGATMASARFDDDSDEKRPTVQVGDPFTEKLLLEACLELMQEDAIIAIQDMGAAGLTSSSVEMASKGGSGLELDLDKVPQREENMTAYEMMLSESQERMLMVLQPGKEGMARAIFEKWGLDFAVIGITNDTSHLTLHHKGEVVADIPLGPLDEYAPKYERPYTEPKRQPTIRPDDVPMPNDLGETLIKLLGSADLASRAWIWQQYDHTVMADTIQVPGGDSAVVRVHGTEKALAISTDVTPRYCEADPFEGGKQAVAETWRNLTAVGAEPLAYTDCLNFGSPEREAIMGQFVGCIEGMAEASRGSRLSRRVGQRLFLQRDQWGSASTPPLQSAAWG